jgi:hypothetical protein
MEYSSWRVLERSFGQQRSAIRAQAQIANTAADSIGARKIEKGNQRVGVQEIALHLKEPGWRLFRHWGLKAGAAQNGFQRRTRLIGCKRQGAQSKVSRLRSARGNDAHVESRFVQVQREALGRQLHRAAVFRGERERGRREAAVLFMGFIEVTLSGKKKRVSGERLWQQAGRNLALLLKDHIR